MNAELTLRQKAEAVLADKQSRIGAVRSESDILRLVHELEVHQIELEMINQELFVQIQEKEQRVSELIVLNKKLEINLELTEANKELTSLNKEKERRSAELIVANSELLFQNSEKTQRAEELIIANIELLFQNDEKAKRAAELILSNKELLLSNDEKSKLAVELILVNRELLFQNDEKTHRADELILANIELLFQNHEKEKRTNELLVTNKLISFQRDRLKEISSLLPGVVYQYRLRPDGTSCFPYASEAINMIYRLTPEEVLEDATSVFANLHPDDHDDVVASIHASAKKLTPWQQEYRVKFKDGTIRSLLGNALPRLEQDGSVLWHGLITDITERKQIENSLRESEEKYRNLYESMKDSVITTDLEGNILDCNQVCLDMLGYTMEEMKNLTYQQFTPVKWRAFDDQIVKPQITARGYSDEYEKEYIRKDGSMIPISLRSWLIKDQDGNPSRFWAIIRDITTRKSTEEKLQSKSSLLEAQLNATTEGILVIDNLNIRLLINQRLIDLLNIPAYILAEKEDSLLLNYVVGLIENPQSFLEKVRYLNTHPDEKSYDEVVFKSGIVLERYSAPMLNDDGKNDGRIWTFRDITSSKLTEKQINLKNEKLHKVNAEMDKFYSIIAHDLRGPIGAIMGLTNIMADDSQYFSEQERKDLTLELSHSSTNVFNLLEQLLEWSKSELGLTDFNPHTLVLNDLVSKSVKIVGEQAHLKSVDLIVNIPTDLTVFADRNMLQTIIRNLISNATKFTRQGGKVIVSAQPVENSSTLISVKDTGIGMSSKILDNLFRIDVDTKRPGTNGEHSTGLGILLCKEFIEKHGGNITVESEEGKGSLFSFTIPYHKPVNGLTSSPIAISKVVKNKTLNSLKVLIAEDDEISGKLLRAMIKGFSNEILMVKTGNDAVKTIRDNPDTDLILLDILMPELDGYEVARQIRQFNSKVIIIAQTALALNSDIERALAAGCNDHIAKPVNSNVLKSLILKYLGKSE